MKVIGHAGSDTVILTAERWEIVDLLGVRDRHDLGELRPGTELNISSAIRAGRTMRFNGNLVQGAANDLERFVDTLRAWDPTKLIIDPDIDSEKQ